MMNNEVQELLAAVAHEVGKIDACVSAMETLRLRVETLANKLEAVMRNLCALNASNIAKAALLEEEDASAAC
jgi:hypothetical protein